MLMANLALVSALRGLTPAAVARGSELIAHSQVRRGSYVYDPFVGTGSVLVAAAYLGAVTLGADIDIRILRGKGGASVASNFAQV